MAVVRGRWALLLVAALLSAGCPEAQAFHGSEDNPTGTVVAPAGGSASVYVRGVDPGDTLQWTWRLGDGSPTEVMATRLVWTDQSGGDHDFSPGPAGRPFGTFVAPANFSGARIVWENGATSPAHIHWAYGASPPFWGRPGIFLPALIPVLLLVACYTVGWHIDRRRRHGKAALAPTDDVQVTGGEGRRT